MPIEMGRTHSLRLRSKRHRSLNVVSYDDAPPKTYIEFRCSELAWANRAAMIGVCPLNMSCLQHRLKSISPFWRLAFLRIRTSAKINFNSFIDCVHNALSNSLLIRGIHRLQTRAHCSRSRYGGSKLNMNSRISFGRLCTVAIPLFDVCF